MSVKLPSNLLGLAFLASVYLGLSTAARAQDDGGPQPILSRALAATVDYGNDAVFQPTKHGTDFDELGLDPGQTVTITVQFPVELAGQTLLVEPFDGGLLTLSEGGLILADDGTISFQFQASGIPGACRVVVHQPDDINVVRFWIMDLDYPDNNPSGLPGAY